MQRPYPRVLIAAPLVTVPLILVLIVGSFPSAVIVFVLVILVRARFVILTIVIINYVLVVLNRMPGGLGSVLHLVVLGRASALLDSI